MQQGRLNRFFHSREFLCKCGCGLFNLDEGFLTILTKARREAAVPFVINSGCRCIPHNEAEGGTRLSGHLTGIAADMRAPDFNTMIAILRGALLAGIPGIALGPNFVHLDIKPRRMIKVYVGFTLTDSGLTIG